MITNISFASINVTDLDRAKAFYADTIGFEVTTDSDAIPGMRWIMLRPGQAETQLHLNLVEALPPMDMPALPFTAPDVPGMVEMLRGKGVEIVKEPGPAEWNSDSTYALFRDSEGNLILIADQ